MTTTDEITQEHANLVARAYQRGDTGWEDDWEDLFLTPDNVEFTLDALERYDGTAWVEARGMERFEIDGHPTIYWEQVQATKGQQRRSLVIVDFTDFRLSWML